MNTIQAGHPVFTHPVVPLLTVRAMSDVDAVADGLVEGGLPVAEVALRSEHGISAIRRLASRGDVLVGAGTVLTVAQAQEALQAGAQFIVTPGLDPDVVRHVAAAGVPVIPGVLTPSEVQAAARLGLIHLKLFPAGAVDAIGYLKAYAEIYPGIRFMPSGGVQLTNVSNYLCQPTVFAVSGSWIGAAVDEGAAGLAKACRAALAAAHSVSPQ